VKQFTPPVIWMLSGVGLMVLAPLIVGITPTGTLSFWSDADQAALQKASGEFHAVNSALADGSHGSLVKKNSEPFDPVAAKARHAAAKAELDKQQRRLRSAQSRPTWLLWTLRLLGVAAAGFGVWGYFYAEPAASTDTHKRTVTLPPKLEALKRRTER
jgi:predicted ribosomally synthesized peptide with SipW-like signal peptide